MRQLIPLYLLVVYLFSSLSSNAQIYYPVTHVSGTQTIGGNNVTATPINGQLNTTICTNIGPYGIGINNAATAYMFQFSAPIMRVRMKFIAFHGSESYSVYRNGVQHIITTNDITTLSQTGCAGPYPLPSVTSGTVINTGGTAVDAAHVVELLFPAPVDSVRVQRHVSTSGAACVFSFEFSYDTIATISAIADTLYCPGDSIFVPFTTAPNFAAGNVFTLQLSNAAGSFASPTNIGTLTGTGAGTIKGVLPLSIPAGTGYKVRIASSNPARVSQPNGETLEVVTSLGTVIASSNAPICEGSTLNLSASTGLSNVTFGWAGPSSFSSTQQNPSLSSAVPSQSGDYIVTVTLNGCSVKDTVNVLVKPMPAAPTAANNSPVCEGTALNLTATSSTAGVSYTWTGPASFSSFQQNPVISNPTVASTGTYNVTATLNGCTSQAGSTTATVKLMPAVPVAGNNTPICAGEDIQLNAISSTSGVSYNWTGPNNFTSTQQNPVIPAATLNELGDYIVSVTLNGCTAEPDTTTAVLNQVSSIGGWVSPNDTICDGTLASFVVVPNNAGPAPQYQWLKNGTAITGANSTLLTTSAIASGDSFYCRMIAPGVCASPLTLYSNGIKMTVLPITTKPSLSISSNPEHPQPGQQVAFTAIVTNGGYKPVFQWKRNGQDVLGAIHANWSANGLHPNDKISCLVISSDVCAEPKVATSDTITINFTTGIDDARGNGVLRLYPNPNNGSFTLSLPASDEPADMEVINAVGQLVHRQKAVSAGAVQVILPSNITAGVYSLRLISGNGVNTVKFAVSR